MYSTCSLQIMLWIKQRLNMIYGEWIMERQYMVCFRWDISIRFHSPGRYINKVVAWGVRLHAEKY